MPFEQGLAVNSIFGLTPDYAWMSWLLGNATRPTQYMTSTAPAGGATSGAFSIVLRGVRVSTGAAVLPDTEGPPIISRVTKDSGGVFQDGWAIVERNTNQGGIRFKAWNAGTLMSDITIWPERLFSGETSDAGNSSASIAHFGGCTPFWYVLTKAAGSSSSTNWNVYLYMPSSFGTNIVTKTSLPGLYGAIGATVGGKIRFLHSSSGTDTLLSMGTCSLAAWLFNSEITAAQALAISRGELVPEDISGFEWRSGGQALPDTFGTPGGQAINDPLTEFTNTWFAPTNCPWYTFPLNRVYPSKTLASTPFNWEHRSVATYSRDRVIVASGGHKGGSNAILEFVQPFSVGSVTATTSSTTVTLAGGAWPTWAADGLLTLQGLTYVVASRTSDTVIVLATAVSTAGGSGLSFRLAPTARAAVFRSGSPVTSQQSNTILGNHETSSIKPYHCKTTVAATSRRVIALTQSGEQGSGGSLNVQYKLAGKNSMPNYVYPFGTASVGSVGAYVADPSTIRSITKIGYLNHIVLDRTNSNTEDRTIAAGAGLEADDTTHGIVLVSTDITQQTPYETGTASVTIGTATVTFSGATIPAWATGGQFSDATGFRSNIASVDSSSQITLATVHPAGLSAAAYSITPWKVFPIIRARGGTTASTVRCHQIAGDESLLVTAISGLYGSLGLGFAYSTDLGETWNILVNGSADLACGLHGQGRDATGIFPITVSSGEYLIPHDILVDSVSKVAWVLCYGSLTANGALPGIDSYFFLSNVYQGRAYSPLTTSEWLIRVDLSQGTASTAANKVQQYGPFLTKRGREAVSSLFWIDRPNGRLGILASTPSNPTLVDGYHDYPDFGSTLIPYEVTSLSPFTLTKYGKLEVQPTHADIPNTALVASYTDRDPEYLVAEVPVVKVNSASAGNIGLPDATITTDFPTGSHTRYVAQLWKDGVLTASVQILNNVGSAGSYTPTAAHKNLPITGTLPANGDYILRVIITVPHDYNYGHGNLTNAVRVANSENTFVVALLNQRVTGVDSSSHFGSIALAKIVPTGSGSGNAPLRIGLYS